jgi:hypothetical protein
MITKELKDYIWLFDEDKKTLAIRKRKFDQGITIPKTQMFSLFRFLIRISQKLSTKKRK